MSSIPIPRKRKGKYDGLSEFSGKQARCRRKNFLLKDAEPDLNPH
jgi:hypothetical protein